MTAVPRLLILETSGRAGQVAVAAGSTLLATQHLDESRRHARDLAPTVARLLAEQGWRPADLDAVIVSRGPGSYTGLRVGVMSAKALAYATGCALLAIDTFAALAAQVSAPINRVDVLGDAQQDKVYWQSFLRQPEGWQGAPLTIVRFQDWLANRHPEAHVTGPGLVKWEQQLPADVPRIAAKDWQPQVTSLLALGLARYQAGQRDDIWTLEPLYLRPSSAEEQWKALGRG